MTVLADALFEWQSPREMKDTVSALGDRLGNRAMRGPGTAFREAFVASEFALSSKAQSVKLLRPRQQATPDFAIMSGDLEKWYETTEADRPGRKRMDEYADGMQFDAVERIPDEILYRQSPLHPLCGFASLRESKITTSVRDLSQKLSRAKTQRREGA